MLTPHILVVDDEPRIREVVHYALQREGWRVTVATTGKEALAALVEQTIDLLVLDIMLPDANGLELCRRIRSQTATPILFLSARGEEIDRVIGLEVGADDYLSKPFGTRELVARIKAVLRRVMVTPASDTSLPSSTSGCAVESVTLDIERHEIRVDGRPLALTHTEFCLLRRMLERPGIVFERAQLMREARNTDTHITERTVDTHIRRLRAKLRAEGLAPIVTVHGVGYKLEASACRSIRQP